MIVCGPRYRAVAGVGAVGGVVPFAFFRKIRRRHRKGRWLLCGVSGCLKTGDDVGFGNMVNADRVIAVVSPDSAPIKRIVQDARDKGAAIDATYGRRTRAVIITDSDHVVLSAFEPEEVLGRFEKEQDKPTV